jgi:hypothetical protein
MTSLINTTASNCQLPERDPKTECYSCKFMGRVAGNTHIDCQNPDPEIVGSRHGVDMGWFYYPILFDPVWKANLCRHFEKQDGKQSKTKINPQDTILSLIRLRNSIT